jgi:hypothetical protein
VNLSELVIEYLKGRSPGWLVLDHDETMACCIDAARYYAAYGDIASISLSNLSGMFPGAPAPGVTAIPPAPDPEPAIVPSLPVKNLGYIKGETTVSVGEWAVIRPLFVLYAERECAMRLEASRAAGIEVYGRSVSEISQDISVMETETLPTKSFSHAIIEV